MVIIAVGITMTITTTSIITSRPANRCLASRIMAMTDSRRNSRRRHADPFRRNRRQPFPARSAARLILRTFFSASSAVYLWLAAATMSPAPAAARCFRLTLNFAGNADERRRKAARSENLDYCNRSEERSGSDAPMLTGSRSLRLTVLTFNN